MTECQGLLTDYLEFNRTGDQIEIQIRNHGYGIDMPAAFDERFGSGSLGLASITSEQQTDCILTERDSYPGPLLRPMAQHLMLF